MIGSRLAHYEITSLLGKGGMGEVYRAHDTRLRRDVAIKVLPPALTANPERNLRFQREAQAVAALAHPNVAVIHEIGEHEGSPFLVMELLQGKTLDEAAQGKPVSLKEWIGYALPIAEGIAHAHRNGIVHRDLKAANVMVTDEGHLKLLDFGLAKLVEPVDEGEHAGINTISYDLTRAGGMIGTVAYMSPEQARGQPVDPRTDIFSFGVLLYQLANGRLPFAGDSDIESLNATLSHDPTPLTEIVPGFAPEAWRIVAKAMEKEPARRYQSADEMVIDFRNLERDLDTGRVSQTGGTAAVSPAKSNRKKLLGTIALVAIAAAISLWQLRPASDADKPTAAQVATGPTRIVVFPFENLGSPEDEFFSAGVTEEIIGRLASIRDLSVISRTSAFQYDRTGKTLQQVGKDFEVEYVLEGTVRWARGGETNRVRIAPQLVRVADDTSIWAEAYNSPMDDIFRVQSDIAGQVIEALGVVLMGAERASLESQPTENQEAYQAYLRGGDALLRTPTQPLAEQMFQRAIDLDPGFALAWAGLSRAHSWRYHGGDRSHGRCEASLSAAEKALQLSPDAPEAHMAMGLYYYRCFRDYERALAEIEIAAAARPNDTDAISWQATINKRQGNYEESIRLNQRVLELDPMDQTSAAELAVTYRLAGELEKSLESYDLAIAIAPDVSNLYFRKALIYIAWKGTTAEARVIMEAMPSSTGALENNAWFWLEFLEGRYAEALARSEAGPETFTDQLTLNVRPALSALCLEQMGRVAEAKTAWQEAVVFLEAQKRERPEDFRVYLDIAVPLAALGKEAEALDAARRAVQMMPISKDAEAAIAPLENLVLTHLKLEQYDEAVQALESVPPGRVFTVPRMRLDPQFRQLVEDPRFEEFAKRSQSKLR